MKNIFLCLFSIGIGNFIAQEYFQQEVNTTIHVQLNDKNHTLSAFEEIEYINHSPDTLSYILIHIWPNAYRHNKTAMGKQNTSNGQLDFYFADSIDRGFIDSLEFKVDGEIAHTIYDVEHQDIMGLYLKEPLLPGGKINISTEEVGNQDGSKSNVSSIEIEILPAE